MKTITFYSYKGGVGRSLGLANIAIRLAEFGKQVCLLDFDLEAPGLHYKFSDYKSNRKINNGIVDYLFAFTNKGILPKNITEYSYSILKTKSKGTITLIPAGNVDSSEYWKMLSTINLTDFLFENSNGISFFLDLKEKIKSELKPDFLLIDSRTGISEISGITLSLLAEEVVIFSANNRENIDGAKKIIASLSKPQNVLVGNIPKITFVLSRVPFTEKSEDRIKEQNLISKLKREFENIINEINIIHSDRELEENEQIKIGDLKDETTTQISRDYLNLFEKLTLNDLSKDEITRFKCIKDAERFYQKAINESKIINKLENINKAITNDPSNLEYFIYRAYIYIQLKELDKALADCNFCISQNQNLITPHQLKGGIYIELEDFNNAKEEYNYILKLAPKHIDSLLSLGFISSKEKNYDLSISYFDKIIEFDKENHEAYNGRGNAKRLSGDYNSALKDIYISLELDPEYAIAYATLAEINAHLNNKNEFYLNLEKALIINKKSIEAAINKEEIYKKFYNDERFLKILDRYKVNIDHPF